MRLSIIIACYNAERTIKRTLDSLIGQEDDQIEIIVVDDCSTDQTCEIVEEVIAKHPCIRLIRLEKNGGPGIARNIAIKEAIGEYIMVIDSDDEMEKGAISFLMQKIAFTSYDIYKFDYYYHNENSGWTSKRQRSSFDFGIYKGVDCEIFSDDNYYICARLWRRQFLIDNDVKYSEGIYYEDIEFALKAYTTAQTAEYIDESLLIIHTNPLSATRTLFDTDYHIYSMEWAMKNVFDNVQFRNPVWQYKTWNTFLKKSIDYSSKKVPSGTENESLRRLLKTLNANKQPDMWGPFNLYGQVRMGILTEPKEIFEIYKQGFKSKRLLNSGFKKIFYSKSVLKLLQMRYKNTSKFAYTKFFDNGKVENIILFQSFDYRYTGNSRYLFEKLIVDKNQTADIYYVTKDERVTANYRIKPYSLEHHYLLAKAKTIYLESWGEGQFYAGKNANIIQLWHGVPFKKLLNDSLDPIAMESNPMFKIAKTKQASRWNQFLTPSPFLYEVAQSAFLLPKEKLLKQQYPRVDWLLENQHNGLKEKYKISYKIPLDKKIIFYAPTWRDYWDTDYDDGNNPLLTKAFFDEFYACTDDYYIIFKPHSFRTSAHVDEVSKYTHVSNAETQVLILISDICITDYSSIAFDFMATDKPCHFIWKDYELYERIKGIYPEFKETFKDLISYNEETFIDDLLKGTKLPIASKDFYEY